MPGGRRVLAYVTPDTAALVGERGADRTRAWPAVADSLQRLAKRTKTAFVLDGEVVAADAGARYDVYDLLLRGQDALLGEPWRARRAALAALFRRRRVADVELVDADADGAAVRARAQQEGWPGFRARALNGTYRPGVTSDEWLEFTLDS
jgi:ATP-dependent DNA ligase